MKLLLAAYLVMLQEGQVRRRRGERLRESGEGGGWLTGIGLLLSVTEGWRGYSLFQGVMSVRVDLEGETLSLFVSSHCSRV